MKTSTLLVIAGVAAGIYFITKKSGSEVPLWYTATAAQIDALRGAGYTEAEIARWNDVAYHRVEASLPEGYVVAWSILQGYYAAPAGISAQFSQHGYEVPQSRRNLPDIYYRKVNALPSVIQDPPYVWPYEIIPM
jgi:hypothetical protein